MWFLVLVLGYFIWTTKKELKQSRKNTKLLAGQMYQVVGALSGETIDDPEVIRALDYLSSISIDSDLVNERFLPFVIYTKEK